MSGWVVGYIVTAGVVVIVAAVALALTAQARRLADEVDVVVAALLDARDGSVGLWRVRETNAAAGRIVAAAAAVRQGLSAGAGGSR